MCLGQRTHACTTRCQFDRDDSSTWREIRQPRNADWSARVVERRALSVWSGVAPYRFDRSRNLWKGSELIVRWLLLFSGKYLGFQTSSFTKERIKRERERLVEYLNCPLPFWTSPVRPSRGRWFPYFVHAFVSLDTFEFYIQQLIHLSRYLLKYPRIFSRSDWTDLSRGSYSFRNCCKRESSISLENLSNDRISVSTVWSQKVWKRG